MWFPWSIIQMTVALFLGGNLEISPRCSLEGLMLKLKLQYFGHLMQRVDSLEKTLMLEGIGGRRRRGRQRRRWLDGISWMTRWTWVWVNSGSWWWTGRPGMLWFMASQRVGHNLATKLNWTCTLFDQNLVYFLLYLRTVLKTLVQASECRITLSSHWT